MADTEFTTINTEVYEEMKEQIRWLEALESAGVDNWEGYDFACEIFNAFVE